MASLDVLQENVSPGPPASEARSEAKRAEAGGSALPTRDTPFLVTESAAKAIGKYLVEHEAPAGAGLRVGVRGGGCSGLSYYLDTDQTPKANDHVIDAYGVKVFIDPKSLLFLRGSTLDYVTGLMESGFKFLNPKAGKGCGCGESFTPV